MVLVRQSLGHLVGRSLCRSLGHSHFTYSDSPYLKGLNTSSQVKSNNYQVSRIMYQVFGYKYRVTFIRKQVSGYKYEETSIR